MALSCITCQVSRSFIRSVCHVSRSRPASVLKAFTLNLVNNVSFSHRLLSTEAKILFLGSKNATEVTLVSQRRLFCSKTKDKKEYTTNDHSESLKERLTKEELEVLKELEEEERRLRESSDKSASHDYQLWEGSFDHETESKLRSSVSEGHVPFQNRQRVIQDVIEEMWNPLPKVDEDASLEPIYYPRGKTGVFDIGELVELLHEEKAEETVVITIPPEMDYADYMLIVTVRNNKHLSALAEFVRKRFKLKERKASDRLPILDRSARNNGWIALDLGNIILHMFLQETRDYYDLETLWSVGPLFDDLTNAKESEIVQLLNTIT